MQAQAEQQVARRRVFYIPGYDPFHPRRYRELYRKEAARQAEISGFEIALKGKHGGDRYGWHVAAQIEGSEVEADVEVLVWSDIVKDSMDQSILGTYRQLVRTAWVYISTGALWRLMRLRKGPVIAALYPVGFLLLQLALALLAARLLGAVLGLMHPWAAWAGVLAVWPVLEAFRRRDNRFFAYYLMHDYAYSAQAGGANPPALEARLDQFRARIREALHEGYDEVLVVGHSSGAHLAVHVLADLTREGVPDGPRLGFLSLGQVVPMVSFLPRAQRLRRDLVTLSEQDRIPWIDITAPGDGCAFALCDPVKVSGVATPAQKGPLILSAAFTKTLSAARWRELRWQFFRLHFQYMCAFDRPGDYDYFRVTAGPMTLAQRFAGRAPSASRIETPVSPFTDLGA